MLTIVSKRKPYSNDLKFKKKKIISMNTEKAFEKTQHPFMIQILKMLE